MSIQLTSKARSTQKWTNKNNETHFGYKDHVKCDADSKLITNYSVTGAGDINARKLPATQVSATVSGAGDILCNATTKLSASITGGGEIKYVGKPQVQCTTARKPFAIGL